MAAKGGGKIVNRNLAQILSTPSSSPVPLPASSRPVTSVPRHEVTTDGGVGQMRHVLGGSMGLAGLSEAKAKASENLSANRVDSVARRGSRRCGALLPRRTGEGQGPARVAREHRDGLSCQSVPRSPESPASPAMSARQTIQAMEARHAKQAIRGHGALLVLGQLGQAVQAGSRLCAYAAVR
ncbi:hypothetical protein A1Q2_08182 [Trichosporon asahii var. asahii CBS 8904]|uniref:Uncharacterized protein n=2 Tax=Trichosporon asahii var. asahii TaxID=189963 RepID=K1W701_TRIAC|nr:hypothetical protein A1Q1_02208 [Trichosporon asahii var. asahii CBS 2479]EJT48788.1 hypothetical protein A1Q1_02208 [Trichosporon asahii var. asahii CBS 2479]EKC97518.1 hypothetical protein A1Q2_08182 [Trichosporon asahii var. asahii CBS 8904]